MIPKNVFCDQIYSAIVGAIGEPSRFVPLHEPVFGGNEWDYVRECIDTGWVSSVGSYVDRFEEELARACGVRHAVCVVNGTAALHISLMLSGVQQGDEVLMPSLTFVATANAASYIGAVPHFVDVDTETLGVCVESLSEYLDDIAEQRSGGVYNIQTGRRIAALLPMHTFGHACEIDRLVELSKKWNIPLIEDAAEALGSSFKGEPLGSFGDMAALSFNGNKILTTGGGGAILTHDPKVARLAKHLTTTAKKSHKWAFDHDQLGFNYRMPNINAALGCAQLEQVPVFVERKRKLAQAYSEAFCDLEGVKFLKEPKGCKSNYWLNVIVLDEEYAPFRDEVLEVLNQKNLMARPVWKPLDRLSFYSSCPKMELSATNSLYGRVVNIPSSANL